jgi:hypothetical protein
MISRVVDWFLRDEHWIIEDGRKTSNVGKLRLIKLERIGWIDYYHGLAMLHQSIIELVSPESFIF